jgi:hypothetical protein
MSFVGCMWEAGAFSAHTASLSSPTCTVDSQLVTDLTMLPGSAHFVQSVGNHRGCRFQLFIEDLLGALDSLVYRR